MAMIEEISGKLQTELGITDASDIAVLTAKVENAYREVKRARNYQPHHTDEFVSADMETFWSNIRNLALYDYNQIGAEGQTSHNENSISRAWKDRGECFAGVTPFVKVI